MTGSRQIGSVFRPHALDYLELAFVEARVAEESPAGQQQLGIGMPGIQRSQVVFHQSPRYLAQRLRDRVAGFSVRLRLSVGSMVLDQAEFCMLAFSRLGDYPVQIFRSHESNLRKLPYSIYANIRFGQWLSNKKGKPPSDGSPAYPSELGWPRFMNAGGIRDPEPTGGICAAEAVRS